MATTTIAKSGGDHTTIAAWEADTDNDLVTATEGEIGEIEDDDTDWDEINTIAGATTNTTYFRTLRAKAGHRHAGVAGDGVVIDPSSSGHVFTISEANFVAEGLQITAWVGSSSEAFRVQADNLLVDKCIIHDGTTSSQDGIYSGNATARTVLVRNTILYDINRCSVHVQGYANQTYYCHNLTVYNCGSAPSNPAIGFDTNNSKGSTSSVMHCTNVVSHAGSDVAFSGNAAGGEMRTENCGANDTSADGTVGENITSVGGNQNSLTMSDQFESITGGSEDFHLKTGADCIDGGADLSSDADLPVTDDIDYATRTGTFDIGADQFVTAGGLTINVSDTVTIDEAQTIAIAPLAIHPDDTVTVSEATTIQIAPLAIHPDDTVTVSDATDVDVAPLAIHPDDTVTVSESTTVAIAPLAIHPDDTVTVSETPTVQITAVANVDPSVSDTVTVSEATTVAIAPLAIHPDDTVTISEAPTVTITGAADLNPSEVDIVTVSESIDIDIAPLAAHPDDTVTISESTTVAVAPLAIHPIETVTISEATSVLISANVTPSVADTVTVSDVATVVVAPLAIHASDTVTISEVTGTIVAPLSIHPVDTVTVDEAVSMRIGSPFPPILHARNVALTSKRRNISTVSGRRNLPVSS